jgi:protein-disulfide isomerase
VKSPTRAAFLAGILALAAGAACTSKPAAAPRSAASSAAAPSGDFEERLRRVEAILAQNADALELLRKVYEQQKRQADDEESREAAPGAVFGVAIDQNVAAGLVDGPPAYVTIIKAFDFACPHCERTSPIMTDLVKEYRGKVRVVYMDRVVHDFAEPVHLAACAAARQGKFIPFKTAFWEKGFGPYVASRGRDRSGYEPDGLAAIAKEAQLDVGRFKTDMASRACADLLARERTELDKFKVDGTPTFFINGLYIPGGLDKAALREIIDDKLRVAEASGVPAAQYYDREIFQKGEKKFRSRKDPKP